MNCCFCPGVYGPHMAQHRETSVTPSYNATEAGQHAAKFIGSQVDMPDVSSRELSCKQSETVRRANTSRRDPFRAVLDARRPVQRPSWTPGGLFGGRLGRQEACPEAVVGARRLVRRPSCVAGGQHASFTAVSLQNAGFAQASVWGLGVPSSKSAKPLCVIFV